jgi:hypothetical protein
VNQSPNPFLTRQRRGVRVTLIVMAIVVLAFTAAGLALLPYSTTPTLTPRSARVEYRIAGSGVHEVRFLNDLGFDVTQAIDGPWVYGFRARPGRSLSLEIRPADGVAAECVITINGTVVSAQRGVSGVSCRATVPG